MTATLSNNADLLQTGTFSYNQLSIQFLCGTIVLLTKSDFKRKIKQFGDNEGTGDMNNRLYHLMMKTHDGKQTEIVTISNCSNLIAAGKELMKKNPGIQYAVTDYCGHLVWSNPVKNCSCLSDQRN